ncbi:MAG: TIGR04282 family arsenosugar biosynthesis glycosyltransferase [Gammaproteobacteria bacterium]|nr:TIGR04282 family arsenosugar biosynthesis glycosyltransferase [Gammaproteobacteria bacterium]
MRYPDTKLMLFAKTPEPGKTKTRLIPALGKEAAAELHTRMIRHTATTAFAAQFSNIEIQCYPHSRHAVFMDILDQQCVELNKQTGDDLGERMANAFNSALAEFDFAIITGTDAPAISSEYLTAAIDQLKAGTEVVLGPAEDGGYVLIGLSRFNASIFTDIDWGTDQVLQQTLQRIEESGMSVSQLPMLWDVDRAEDLSKLAASKALSFLTADLWQKF